MFYEVLSGVCKCKLINQIPKDTTIYDVFNSMKRNICGMHQTKKGVCFMKYQLFIRPVESQTINPLLKVFYYFHHQEKTQCL